MRSTCLETLKGSLVSHRAALSGEETTLEVDAEAGAGADRFGIRSFGDP